MSAPQAEPIPDDEAEEVFIAYLGVPIALDPVGLPPRDSEEFKVIVAEHVIAWLAAVDFSPAEAAINIDRVDFVERRRC